MRNNARHWREWQLGEDEENVTVEDAEEGVSKVLRYYHMQTNCTTSNRSLLSATNTVHRYNLTRFTMRNKKTAPPPASSPSKLKNG